MKLRWTKRSQGDLVEIGRQIGSRSNPKDPQEESGR
jgi:hypothetical protein